MLSKLPKSRIRRTILLLSILAIVSVAAALCVNLRGPAPDKMTREEVTHAKMKRILICIQAYQSDKKEWPLVRSWGEQLKPYFVRDAFFSPEAVLIDGWGNGIKYWIRSEGGHPEAFLYSCGRNGVDDKGANDDILIQIPPWTSEKGLR
jgi:hypothetical protein